MAKKLLELSDEPLMAKRTFGFVEDFFEFVTGDLFTSLAADTTATVAASDAAGGVLVITTDATANNEAAVFTTKKPFKFASGKPLRYQALVKYAEAATDDAAVFIGLSSAFAADLMVNTTGVPASNMSAVGFFKSAGDTLWSIITSLGTTQNKVQLTAANSLNKAAQTAGGTAYVDFVIEVNSISTTEAEACFYIDGSLVYKQVFTYTSAVEMKSGVYVKSAGGATGEVVYVDLLATHQQR